ncbi:hypothetical protein LENED_004877 [Lentinula edodes]|uniref:Uncharacterized protein n=1 Tax=Lentinula edodes TaxID=5353 RepID=A0A1Q3E7L6_LENED|nr:hypothetical protein LENED_004877 [Lentinula edodes]
MCITQGPGCFSMDSPGLFSHFSSCTFAKTKPRQYKELLCDYPASVDGWPCQNAPHEAHPQLYVTIAPSIGEAAKYFREGVLSLS